MTKTLKNLKNVESERPSEKKFSVSGGTILFLTFNILLITGFCKFSFYVLKNHRSALERDTLVKTYVDVQPYNSGKRVYTALNDQNRTAPAPFFINEEKQDSFPLIAKKESVSEDKKNTPRFPPIAKSTRRVPVIRTTPPPADTSFPVQKEADQQQPIIIKSVAHNDSPAVSLDNLMISGLDLLNESEKTIASSELLLQEAVPSEQENIKDELPRSKPAAKEKETASENLPIRKSLKRSVSNETRWVDVAELRRQLKSPEASAVPEKESRSQQNAALLQMNGAKQVASSDTKIISDTQETPSLINKVSDSSQPKESPEKTLKESPDNNLSATAPASPEEKKEETSSPVQLAVVQDVPFAGTAPVSNQETAQLSKSVQQSTTLSGNSPSLWKIAKTRASVSPNLAGKPKEKDEKEQSAKKEVESEVLPQTAKKDVIYRNGRVASLIPNQEKKSLNWLDRQKAAVWTSMAQSDTPSVWSSATEPESTSSDKARAFRVAEEQPAAEENVINSAPVRIVGEDAQPETKENPLLLPLGTPAATAKATPVANVPAKNMAPQFSPAMTPQVNAAPASVTSAESTASEKAAAPAEEGLMNKFFSFFGKTEASNSLPNIGSGTPLPEETPKQEEKQLSEKPKARERITSVIPTPSKTKTEEKQIIPTELRLTFKPNSTEISAQSIKWIKAFGQKAKKDIQNAVEVRMSNTDSALQSKRFAIIRNTLTGVGMESVQIIPVITDRTPHTVVLRMIVLPEEGYTEYTTETNGIQERVYYKQW